jgi:mono/diheme cytochrome c family protein
MASSSATTVVPGPLRGLVLGALLSSACGGSAADGASPQTLPWGEEGGPKSDVFGRSLVGAPNPYPSDPALVADPVGQEARLAADMRARRAQGWATAFKALEPVPLLGLADQLDARPACEPGVADKDLDKCEGKGDEAACGAMSSGDVTGICGWDADAGTCAPVCDNLTLPDGEEIPRIPRWETWYGVEDVNRIFAQAYAQLDEEDKLGRAPLSDFLIGQSMRSAHEEKDRSDRWPLRRYTDAVLDLFGCDLTPADGESDEAFADRCALARQSEFSGASAAGGGIARIMYSPAMVLHVMRNYAEVLGCPGESTAATWCEGPDCADPPDNFSTCFGSEFPGDAGDPFGAFDPAEVGDEAAEGLASLPHPGGSVLIKAVWSRVGFGFELPAYDTNAEALKRRIEPGARAEWEPEGDRLYGADSAFPGPDDIYTIQTRAGSVYRLTGLHIMSKELRHWQWVTLWWSDDPDTDFGEDRPANFAELPAVWGNYKMCTVVDYTEKDADVVGRFSDMPSLAAALGATDPTTGAPTWCSNPYIEHERGNARTNCIGCHQHAGTRIDESGGEFKLETVIPNAAELLADDNRYPANGRTRRRNRFPADYSWAFSRIDDLTELMRTEVEFLGSQDPKWTRMKTILEGEGDAVAGEFVFRETTTDRQCTGCHGEQGEGGFGPSLSQVFASKTEWSLLHTVIEGRGSMPAWGETLDDTQLTDLFAYLRANFTAQ